MPAFTVVGDVSRERLVQVAWQLDRFRQALLAFVPGASLESPIPLTVVVVGDPRSFRQFVWRSGRGSVGGYFGQTDDGAYIVFPEWGGDYGLQVVFHEYTHFLVRRSLGDAPIWFNEGLAELYSTFGGSEKDTRSLVGRPIGHHLGLLRSRPLLPLEDLMTAEGAQKIGRSDADTRMFYAQAWVLMHYLVLGDGGTHRQALLGFVRDQRQGVPFEKAFATHFGMSTDRMEALIGRYAGQQTMRVIDVRLDVPRPTANLVQGMTEVEALQAQADVQILVGELDGAERKLSAASTLDRAHVATRVSLGKLRLAQRRVPEAIDVLSAVAADASEDARVFQVLGDALVAGGRMEEALGVLERSLALGSRAPAVLFQIGVANMSLERWPESVLAFAKVRQLDPSPSWQARRAMVSVQHGRGPMAAEAARTYLRQAEWTDLSRDVALAGVYGSLLAGRPEQMEEFLSDIEGHGQESPFWPALVGLLRGSTSAEALMAKAHSELERTEARVAIAYKALAEGNREVASQHLQWVKAKGDLNVAAAHWAVAELSRLERAAPRAEPQSGPR